MASTRNAAQATVIGSHGDDGLTNQSAELQLGTDQLPLFAGGAPRIEATAAAHRIQLDETSWLEHVPAWLSGSETLLAELADTNAIGWEGRKRWMYNQLVDEPRLTAQFPESAKRRSPSFAN